MMSNPMKNFSVDSNHKDDRTAEMLGKTAQQIEMNPSFQAELERSLKEAYKSKGAAAMSPGKFVPAFGWAIALIVLVIALNWAIRSLAPEHVPALGGILTPTGISFTKEAPIATASASGGTVYDWHGTPLMLAISPPESPTEARVYLYQPGPPANLDSARALAAQLGLDGQVYGSADFLFADDNQRLVVHPDGYFEYYPDFPRWRQAINGVEPPPDAETQIDDFLQAHGFTFPHEVKRSELYGGYLALPLTPDGHPICYEYFLCAGLQFTLDNKGILFVSGALPKYEQVGQYGILTAQEAFQRFINPVLMSDSKAGEGMIEGMHSPSGPIATWLRPRPADQTITLYGFLSSVPARAGGPPLVTLEGYTVTGNTVDVPADLADTFVEATGQIHDQNGMQTFELQSWKTREGSQDGLLGTIERQGQQVILNSVDGGRLLLPDVPADLPLPLENAFVIGVRQAEIFEWTSIDLRNTQGGRGGGGGGLGFYKLNLTGTPVPFPTPAAPPPPIGSEGAVYLVQAGDTLSKIASAYGLSVEALVQANGIQDPGSIYIGQMLVIPGAEQNQPQRVEGLRGFLSITIYGRSDGSQRVEYGLVTNQPPFPYLRLEGKELEGLQAYQNRPADVWGTVTHATDGTPELMVERYEIPFPDLQFQIMRGRQELVTLEGQAATLFTSKGQTYVQFSPGGTVDGSTVGLQGGEVLLEALLVPGERFGGYPVARVFQASMATNPKNGQPVEMQVTADQVYLVEEQTPAEIQPPAATVERIELVYYMPDPRNAAGEVGPEGRYLQPAWLFSGHYSNGDEFFVLVQALKQEFLLPELAPFNPPG